MASSLLDPVLSVTKRNDAAQFRQRSAALLAEVIEVRLRRLERALAGNARIHNTVAAQKALHVLRE